MFIGDNKEAHQSATQKLMEAAIHLRRASDALMAVQGMTKEVPFRSGIGADRAKIDSMAAQYDVRFQEAAQTYFA